MFAIGLSGEINLATLAIQSAELAADISQNGSQACVWIVIDVATLVKAGQESALTVDRIPAKRNEARHVLVHASQTVDRPRAKAGLGQLRGPCSQHAARDFMVRDFRKQGLNDRQVIRMLGYFWENLTDFQAGFSAFVELEGRAESDAFVTGDFLAVVLLQLRLVVPSVDGRRGALSVNLNNSLRLPRKMGGLGSQRPCRSGVQIEGVDAK